MSGLDSLADGPGVSWLLAGVLALAVLENLVSGDLIWTGFLVVTLVVLALPAAIRRDASAMLPPEVVALAVLPGVSRAVGPVWVTEYAVYLGVAALALAVVMELSLFTSVEMAPWFATALVVLTTMAAIGVWAVLQFYSDRFLGTELIGSLNAVNWEFVRATVAGVAAAAVFERYFEVEAGSDASVSDAAEADAAEADAAEADAAEADVAEADATESEVAEGGTR